MADAFHCENCEQSFTESPHATDDGYWLCHPCWRGLTAENTARDIVYTTFKPKHGAISFDSNAAQRLVSRITQLAERLIDITHQRSNHENLN